MLRTKDVVRDTVGHSSEIKIQAGAVWHRLLAKINESPECLMRVGLIERWGIECLCRMRVFCWWRSKTDTASSKCLNVKHRTRCSGIRAHYNILLARRQTPNKSWKNPTIWARNPGMHSKEFEIRAMEFSRLLPINSALYCPVNGLGFLHSQVLTDVFPEEGTIIVNLTKKWNITSPVHDSSLDIKTKTNWQIQSRSSDKKKKNTIDFITSLLCIIFLNYEQPVPSFKKEKRKKKPQ